MATELSRDYSISSVDASEPLALVGKDTALACIASGDSAWIRAFGTGSSIVFQFRFLSDGIIPNAASILRAEADAGYATTFALDENSLWLLVGFGETDAEAQIVSPSTLTTNIDNPAWHEDKATLTIPAPSVAATSFNNNNGTLSGFFFNTLDEFVFVDQLGPIRLFFTLPAPSVGDGVRVVERNRNHLKVSAIVNPEGGASLTYPASTYFEWTESDPEKKLSAGVGQVFTTTSQIIVNNQSTEIYATLPDPFEPEKKLELIPSTAYWIRVVVSNASNTVKSAWTQATTLLSDPVLL